MADGGSFMAGAITAKMLMDLTGWNSGIKKVTGDTKKVGDDVNRMGQLVANAGKAMAAVGGAITGSLFAMTKATANAGDQINDFSKRTGISAEALSAYKYAAEQSGTSIEGVVTGLRRLSSGMLDASRGLETSKQSFDELGISVTNADGTLRPMNDVLLDAADRFSKMEDGTKKAALAQDLFGRSGMDLIPLLNEGRDGLARMLAEAERLGVVFTAESAAASDAFNDSLSKLKSSVAGVTKEFTTTLMPTITEFVGHVTNAVAAVTGWMKEHPELTKAIAGTALQVGAFVAAAGTMLLIIGKLSMALNVLAFQLGTTAGVLTASLGAWAAIAVAAFKVYTIVSDLIKANERLVDSDFALFQAEQKLGAKLREAADAAGMTRREFVQLTDKYHGNVRALTMAIKTGREGVELQNALADVSAKHKAAIDEQRAATEKNTGAMGGLGNAIDIVMPKMAALTDQSIDAAAAFQKMSDANIGQLIESMSGEMEIAEIPIEMDLGGLEESTSIGLGILDEFVAAGAEQSAAASENARAILAEHQKVSELVFADIINGFGDIISADKSMGQIFADITKKMIADMGKLIIQEMLFSKKSILAKQMESVASFISSIFKKIPFPLNVVLAAGAFALVSKLFSKLTKFAEGGAFEKPTVIQNAVVGEAGPEYLLPEAKLVRIVQNAMRFNPFTAVPTLMPAAAPAGGSSIAVNINSPLITTVGLTRHDLESAGEELMAVIESQLRRSGKAL